MDHGNGLARSVTVSPLELPFSPALPALPQQLLQKLRRCLVEYKDLAWRFRVGAGADDANHFGPLGLSAANFFQGRLLLAA